MLVDSCEILTERLKFVGKLTSFPAPTNARSRYARHLLGPLIFRHGKRVEKVLVPKSRRFLAQRLL